MIWRLDGYSGQLDLHLVFGYDCYGVRVKVSLKVPPIDTPAPPAPVAQRIEQRFPKPRVGRSSRPRGTRKKAHFAEVGAIGLSVPMGLKESRGVAQSGSAAVSKF